MNVRLLSYSQPSEEFADIGVTVIAKIYPMATEFISE